jgi:hypothetical protein
LAISSSDFFAIAEGHQLIGSKWLKNYWSVWFKKTTLLADWRSYVRAEKKQDRTCNKKAINL